MISDYMVFGFNKDIRIRIRIRIRLFVHVHTCLTKYILQQFAITCTMYRQPLSVFHNISQLHV